MRIFTIGYEGATAGEFLAALASAGVERVIDVRALPLSRRPGFSKSPLRAALAEAGLDYVHLKALGTPAAGRAAARAGRYQDVARIYADQLELPEAIAETARMLDLADEKPSALLCYERDPARCHRSLLLAAAAPDADVTHLYALIDGRKMMLDHVGFAVSDLKRSRLFYEAALAPLGLSVLMEVTPDMTESGGTAIGFGKDRHPFFWIGDNERVGEGTHVAFTVENRALVDAFHAAAVAAGGRDHGAPGLRPHYHPNYYAAFVLDPDGINVEAVCHAPE